MTIPFLDLTAANDEVAAELELAWKEGLETSGFIGGPSVSRFEANWANACGTTYCVGVANGTDALELCLAGAGIGAGDEVIVPANSFIATAEAVARVGATPVFADVDPQTMLIRSSDAEAVRTEQTRALIGVHLYGQCVDFDDVVPWCETNDVLLLEDAAQAHGATSHGRRAGSVGYAGSFSFYPGKNLGALGDGGAVTTNDGDLAATIRTLANHGRAAGHYEHTLVGRNSRLDGLQAAFLDIKLAKLDAWNEKRRAIWARYVANLSSSGSIELLSIRPDAVAVHHLAIAQVDNRDGVRDALSAAGIATGIHYPTPCHQQPAFAAWHRGALPTVEAIAPRLVSLPIYPQLTDDAVDTVCEVVDGCFR